MVGGRYEPISTTNRLWRFTLQHPPPAVIPSSAQDFWGYFDRSRIKRCGGQVRLRLEVRTAAEQLPWREVLNPGRGFAYGLLG